MTTNKDFKCPVCDQTNFKEENGFYVCQICGNKIPIKSTEPKLAISQQHNSTDSVNIIINLGLIGGVIGILIFFSIIFVGLTIFGRVYFYDGYKFTGVLTTISIILMIVGFWSIIAKCIRK